MSLPKWFDRPLVAFFPRMRCAAGVCAICDEARSVEGINASIDYSLSHARAHVASVVKLRAALPSSEGDA